MSDPEQGIAQTQIEAARRQGADGLARSQQSSIAYLDERIVMFLCVLGLLGLLVVWATAKSAWLLYGSLALVIALVVFWGYARIQRIERLRAERAREAASWQKEQGDT
ncbi:MAG: hypothetical protein QNJ85_12005 [Gammaproteobacteria bacterium]|nr:hypothetical protein [Gammaproteobacteria bacterium]